MSPAPDSVSAIDPSRPADLREQVETIKTQVSPVLDVEQVRKDFPILQTVLPAGVPLVYLDNAASTQVPRPVLDAIMHCYETYYANVHRGVHWLSDQTTNAFEEAREKVRAFINAPSIQEVIFTRGTTEGINLVARSWGDSQLKAGDEILLSELEHHSNLVPWQQLAERTGAVLRHLPITDSGELQLEHLDRLLTRKTRLVALTAVSNVLGTFTQLEEIIPRAHELGAVVLVDAAQSVPHGITDVQKLGADFLAFSGHKMLGTSGIGVLYGRQELLEAMPPFLGGGSMIRRVQLDSFSSADLPAKFEAGTPAIVPAIALGAAIDYLNRIGMPAIVAHEHALVTRAHELLTQVSGVRLLGPPPERKAGIVSFTLMGARNLPIHAHDIAQLLDRQGIAVRAGHHCAMPLHKRLGLPATSRASFYLYNTLSEVDHLAAALEQVKQVFSRPHA